MALRDRSAVSDIAALMRVAAQSNAEFDLFGAPARILGGTLPETQFAEAGGSGVNLNKSFTLGNSGTTGQQRQ